MSYCSPKFLIVISIMISVPQSAINLYEIWKLTSKCNMVLFALKFKIIHHWGDGENSIFAMVNFIGFLFH